MNTRQYNKLISDLCSFLVHAKLRSALSRIGGADAMVLQSIVGEELAQGPYVAAKRYWNLQHSGRKAPNLPLSHHAQVM